MTYSISQLIQNSHFVQRWNGVNILNFRRSVSQHHVEVAGWCIEFQKFLNKNNLPLPDNEYVKILEYSLTHDLPEVITGDVKYVVKKAYPNLKESLNLIEEEIFKELGMCPTDLTKFIVKIGDILAVEKEIYEELQLIKTGTKKNCSIDGTFNIQNVSDIITDVFNAAQKNPNIPDNFIKLAKDFINLHKSSNVEF